MAMKPQTLRKAHRWIALLFSISILMSAGSGIFHNIMAHLQTPLPSARPGGTSLDLSRATISPKEAEAHIRQSIGAKNPMPKIVGLNLRLIEGKPWYQIVPEGKTAPFYVDAADGRFDPAQDEKYAWEIASNFLNGRKFSKSDYLTAFNGEYVTGFRILPVYRFDVDDGKGTRLYVSTVTGNVTRSTDNQRQFESKIFRNFHELKFIPNPNVRDAVLITMISGLLIASILGIVLFFTTKSPR